MTALINEEVLVLLGTDPAHITPDQIAALSTGQIAALRARQIAALSTSQILSLIHI